MLRDEMNPIYWKEIFIQILIFISYIEKKGVKIKRLLSSSKPVTTKMKHKLLRKASRISIILKKNYYTNLFIKEKDCFKA